MKFQLSPAKWIFSISVSPGKHLSGIQNTRLSSTLKVGIIMYESIIPVNYLLILYIVCVFLSVILRRISLHTSFFMINIITIKSDIAFLLSRSHNSHLQSKNRHIKKGETLYLTLSIVLYAVDFGKTISNICSIK